MPRLARLDISGLLQHVIVRGIDSVTFSRMITTGNFLLAASFLYSPKPVFAAMHGRFYQITFYVELNIKSVM